MERKLALVGGDEFRRGCEAMDEAILRTTSKASPVVLIVPTAAAFENPALAADNGARYFSALGADARPLMVLDRSDAESHEMALEVESADVVYLTGGSPIHLLETLRESAVLAATLKALERGAVLAGSSAGAMVMGSWMRFREWRPALEIADGIASLPHHERSDPNTVSREIREGAPDESERRSRNRRTFRRHQRVGWVDGSRGRSRDGVSQRRLGTSDIWRRVHRCG